MSEVLGPKKGYVDLLNEATTAKLTKDKATGKDFQKTPIRPSASGDCARALFYSLQQFHGLAKYETELKEPEVHRLLSLGHFVESHVIRQFEMLSDLFEIRYKQQVLSFAYLKAEKNPALSQWLEGSLDLVFWSEKYKCVADVKSKKDKFNIGFKSAWDDLDSKLGSMKSVTRMSDEAYWVENLEEFLDELNDPFFAANFKQLNMYACSDFLKERGINHGAILQYNKNDSRMREVRFKPSEALYRKTIQKFQDVITAVDTGKPELAPREYVLGSVKCAFCPYKTECWAGKDAKKAFFATFPKKEWPTRTERLGKAGDEIELLFDSYREQGRAEMERKKTEQSILKHMVEQEIDKVQLENGEVYEARQLKDGLVLRRSKA